MSSGWGGNQTSASPGPSGDHTVYTEQFTLTPEDVTNQYVNLTFSATDPKEVTVNPDGGPEQIYGQDFTATSSQVSWAGYGLGQLLDVGDILVVTYPILT